MIVLTDEMKEAVNNALADKAPCILATASLDGRPSVGYRGSVMAFTDSSLAYWERTFRKSNDNVALNPHVVIMYRNPATRKAWKFFGRATVHAELDRDPDRRGVAVVVELDRVEMMSGEVLMKRE
jgi:hypothetical protein